MVKISKKSPTYEGRGILFAVISNDEMTGSKTTAKVLSEAIACGLEAGFDTPEKLSRFLLTTSFNHVSDKRVRYNLLFQAGDRLGARLIEKLHNSYSDLALKITKAEKKDKKLAQRQALGFAQAMAIILNPIECENTTNPSFVVWQKVNQLAQEFIATQGGVYCHTGRS